MMKIKDFDELSVLIECSTGSTPTVKTLKKYIDLLAEFGYTQLYLGLTDGFKMEGEPYFNYCRGGYTTEQLQEIDAYAESKGIELRANIQVLAHLPFMQYHDCYKHLFDSKGILMVGKEEVYDFIDKIFATMSKGVKSRTIHIGMDEAWNLGLGEYLVQHGYTEKKVILLEHLNRVVKIAKKYNYTCEIWSDMFYRMVQGSVNDDNGVMPTDVRGKIPEGVRLVHWKYDKQTEEVLRKQIMEHQSICDDLVFAGGACKWHGLAPDNKYSIDAIERQLAVCREQGVRKYMVTLWSDRGGHCSYFAVLPTLFAVGEMASGKSKDDIDKDRFKEITGVAFDDFMLLDNLNNPFLKDIETLNSRCYWGFLSDILLGHYDLYLDEHTDEAYEALSERYATAEAGEYQDMFNDYVWYAKVLSIKMNIGVRIRAAYREGNRELLKQYATIDIPKMSEYMRRFVDNFNARWLSENMSFGLEVHHLFYGGQIERWNYVAQRILKFLETGEPIEEVEREELIPSIIPQKTEDNCREMDYFKLISRCGI